MKKAKLVLLSTALVMFISMTANATDYYAGTECAMGFDGSNNAYYDHNRALNNNTSLKVFYCPINSDSGTATITGGMYLLDTSTSNISCSLRAYRATSTSYHYSSASSSGNSTIPEYVSFGTVVRSGGYPYVYVYCYVPGLNGAAKSGIHSYFTN